LRCPYCDSPNVVWDYEKGEIICEDCASVVEKIYVSSIDRNYCITEIENEKVRIHEFMPRLSKMTREYLKILKDVGGKDSIVIDINAFLEYQKTGRRVKVLRRRASPNVDLLLKDTTIRTTMSILQKYPRLSARTDRAKVAIALLALSLIKGAQDDISSLTKETGLSKVHIRRLEKLILKERLFIEELKEVIGE